MISRHFPSFPLCSITLIAMVLSCQRPGLQKEQELMNYFKLQPPTDTLLVEITEETELPETGDTIPNALFFSTIPPTLLQEIDYLADSAEAVVLGHQHFPLGGESEAYWVEVRQFWFKHHSLLVYDKAGKTFTDRITVAEWYGGDGGQVLIGSWIFDYDGDGQKDIVRRDIQHSMVPDGDTVLERTSASATLLLWEKKKFAETPLADTAATVRRYPIQTMW